MIKISIVNTLSLPFPYRIVKKNRKLEKNWNKKLEEDDTKILNIFRKVGVIP